MILLRIASRREGIASSAAALRSIGLKPIIRRIWVDEWTVPVANVNWRFEWLWLYGFVHPQSGEIYWWILPFVNTEIFNQVLADFAQHFDAGDKKQIVLALDQAGWHTAKKLDIPHRTFNNRIILGDRTFPYTIISCDRYSGH